MICVKCSEEKLDCDFHKRSGYLKRSSTCKKCWAARNKIWRDANPDRVKSRNEKYRKNFPVEHRVSAWKSDIKKKYGIDLDQYNALLQNQNGLCAVCKRSPETTRKMAVDHCHTTGKVRALLCDKCNRGLGCFSDDPVMLAKALAYLVDHGDQKTEVIAALMDVLDRRQAA